MRENYSFEELRRGLENQKEKEDRPSRSVRGHLEMLSRRLQNEGDHEVNSIDVVDDIASTGLFLREVVEEKLNRNSEIQEEQTRASLLQEMVSPRLIEGYKSILHRLRDASRISEGHPVREWIDIESEDNVRTIESWISELIHEVGPRSKNFSETDDEDLRASSWMFFQAVANVLNAKTVEADIVAEKKRFDEEGWNLDDEDKAISERLAERYPLSVAEIRAFLDLRGHSFEDYSPKILLDIISHLWREHGRNISRKDAGMLATGHLTVALMESYAPALWGKMIPGGNDFDIKVFLEYSALSRGPEWIEAWLSRLVADMELKIRKEINERIANTFFFQNFEFMQEQTQGEILSVLEEGREATIAIMRNTVTRLAPALFATAGSLAFLTSVNPILGGIGLAGVPAMVHIAKKRGGQFWKIHSRSRKLRSKYLTRISATQEGYEQVRISPELPEVARTFKDDLDAVDEIITERQKLQAWARTIDVLPKDIAGVIAGVVGAYLVQEGVIPPGAVLSNIQYSERLQRPIEDLMRLYLQEFPTDIQNVRRMEKLFGEYEALDVPDGEMDKERISTSRLPNFTLRIENLSYKDILHNINLEIPEGQLVVIHGRSGTGKTTLMRNMVGLYEPSAGSVSFGGVEVDKIKRFGPESIYAHLAYSNQKPQIFPDMTLRENLLLWTRREVSDEEIVQTLRKFNLANLSHDLDKKNVHYLSGGELVRVGLVRAVLKKPRIMFLDEPTSGLDRESQVEVRELLQKLHHENSRLTIVCISHDEKLEELSDRGINLKDLSHG